MYCTTLATHVALAFLKRRVRLEGRSSFEGKPGTLLVSEEDIVEQEVVSGIAYSRDEAKITLLGVPDRPGVAAGIFGPLTDANINVDMIVQNVSEGGVATDLTFTVSKGDFERALKVLDDGRGRLGIRDVVSDPNVEIGRAHV